LFSQYLNQSFGYDPDPVDAYTNSPWTELHNKFVVVASNTPWTFGAALERAEAIADALARN
jgi:hypothetical protein